MSTILCPSCAGRGSVGVYSRSGGQVDAISTTTCLTCAGSGSIGPKWAYVAICPYCGTEHETDVVNASGECPTVACCGETHCLDKRHPTMIEEYDDNF